MESEGVGKVDRAGEPAKEKKKRAGRRERKGK